jgi:predicted ArsR family transcriptional regulator
MHDHDDLQVFRQWMILRTLGARRHGMSVRELAEECGVDRQTIRRDLKLLQTQGFPLVESKGARGRKRWSSPRNEGCPHLQFHVRSHATQEDDTFPYSSPVAPAHYYLRPPDFESGASAICVVLG